MPKVSECKKYRKKIIAGKIKIFNIKKQDVQEQVSKIALHTIIPVELCDDNSNTVSIFQNHISSDQQNNLSQILNTIRDWNDDTSLSGATADTESEGITGC